MYVDIILRPVASDYFPSFVPARLSKKSLPYSRIGEIVELFNENIKTIKSEEFNQTEIEKYTGAYRFYGSKYYCFTYDKENSNLVEYVFESVDTSRPWTITSSSEGGEHLHYFDDDERFEIRDKDLNYGVYI